MRRTRRDCPALRAESNLRGVRAAVLQGDVRQSEAGGPRTQQARRTAFQSKPAALWAAGGCKPKNRRVRNAGVLLLPWLVVAVCCPRRTAAMCSHMALRAR